MVKIHFVSSECLKGNGKKIPNAWFLRRSAPIHRDILRSKSWSESNIKLIGTQLTGIKYCITYFKF